MTPRGWHRVPRPSARLGAECHGANGEGGAGPRLLGPVFMHGGDEEALARSVRQGYPPKMPGFGTALSEAQIRSVVDFLKSKAKGDSGPALLPDAQGRTRAGSYAVQVPHGCRAYLGA